MKILLILISALIIAAAIYFYKIEKNKQQEQFVAESSQLIKQLATGLKQELSKAIEKHGVAAAIQTCNIQAPIVTAQTHADSPLSIRRTSLKWRNPANAPDDWERGILEKFEQQLAQGTAIEQLTYTSITNENGKKILRFMRAIPTNPICLNCHGSENNLTAEVQNMLNKEYPNDQAIGFAVGDIRGAFSVSQTLDN